MTCWKSPPDLYWPNPDTSPIENVYGPEKVAREQLYPDRRCTANLPTFDSDFAWFDIVELLHAYKLRKRDMVAIF